jgi:hypothetical protein
MMQLSDGDLEFVLAMYDAGKVLMANEPARELWADATIKTIVDYGFDLDIISTELGEHDTHLAVALDLLREFEEEHEEEETYFDDEESDEY